MMKTNKELLAIARKQIGNNGKKYRKYVGVGGSWCDMFVFWLYDANGCGSLLTWKGQQRYYCPASIKWCRKYLAQIPPYLAMACDPIYFDWDKNGIPNHIGIVESKKSAEVIKTIEGNTSGGKVDRKNRNADYVQAVFRPLFKPSVMLKLGTIRVDGSFQWQSIANLQRALGLEPTGILDKSTVKALQKKAGADQDGSWQTKTSKAVQKLCGLKGKDIDGIFGEKSTRALQRWINEQNAHEDEVIPEPVPEPVPEPEPVKPKTKAEKIIAEVEDLAWPEGTKSSTYGYKKGRPKELYKVKLKKYVGKSAKISQSDCGYFPTTIIRALGISKKFLALGKPEDPFPSVPSTMKIVHKGKIKKGVLKPADIIRYKKKKKKQHTLIYLGNGKIADAGRGHWFPRIKKNNKPYNKSNVRKSTIEVIRVKE